MSFAYNPTPSEVAVALSDPSITVRTSDVADAARRMDALKDGRIVLIGADLNLLSTIGFAARQAARARALKAAYDRKQISAPAARFAMDASVPR